MHNIHVSEIVNNRDVVIPFELLKSLNHQKIEIVIFPQPVRAKEQSNQAHALSKIFAEYKDISPFSQIKNASLWQKKVRNEW